MSLKNKPDASEERVTSMYDDVAFEIRRGLTSLREEKECTDFEVIVGGQTFYCHKAVLASVSDYFRAMFQSGMKEVCENRTTLNNVTSETFQVIIDILYLKGANADPLSSQSDEMLGELLCVADMFQMKFLSKLCLKVVEKTISASNCVHYLKISKTCRSDELHKIAQTFIIKHFDEVADMKAMPSLDYKEFCSVLTSEHLIVNNEVLVWHAISEWINFDKRKRKGKLKELLDHCYLKELDQKFLTEVMAFDNRIQSDVQASKLVLDAVKFKNHPAKHGNVDLKFRSCTNKVQVAAHMYIHDRTATSFSLIIPEDPEQKMHVSKIVPEVMKDAREFSCCLHGQDMYVSGGTSKHRKLMHKYSGENDRWVQCDRSMPVDLKRHAMVATDDSLYLLGGRSGEEVNATVLRYCLSSEIWYSNGEIQAPVENASAACVNDKIYIFGGEVDGRGSDETAKSTDNIQMYDTKTKTGTILPCKLPSLCAFSRTVVKEDDIVVVTTNGEVIRFSVDKLEPKVLTVVPGINGRTYFGLYRKDNRLKVCGGRSKARSGKVNTFELDLTSGKVLNKHTQQKGFYIYGLVSIVVKSEVFDT